MTKSSEPKPSLCLHKVNGKTAVKALTSEDLQHELRSPKKEPYCHQVP